jgi:tetratricopeptide (TPR) repeat protein
MAYVGLNSLQNNLSILLEELHLAFSWSRPSILLAVHRSKTQLEKAQAGLEHKLRDLQKDVIRLRPTSERENILLAMREQLHADRIVFFVDGLGAQKKIYDGLNLYRETVVENQLKIVFWLAQAEIAALPRLAPDFWSFRHRVIDFSPHRVSSITRLPSGVLLWGVESPPLDSSSLDSLIAYQKNALQALPSTPEALAMRTDITHKLAHLLWLRGDNPASEAILLGVLGQVERSPMRDKESGLLNALAIHRYDRREYKDALKFSERALAQNPSSGILHANHGIVCRSAGKGKESVRWMKKAIRIQPNSAELWGALGYLFASMGRFDDALPAFENAARGGAIFQLCAALCHSRIGNHDLRNDALRSAQVATRYEEICLEGIVGRQIAGLNMLRDALVNGEMSEAFVNRDAGLNMIFGSETLQNVVTSPASFKVHA